MDLTGLNIGIVMLQGHRMFQADPQRPMGGSEVQMFQLGRLLHERCGARLRFVCLAEGDAQETYDGLEVATLARSRSVPAKARGILDALETYRADVVLQRCWGIESWLAARYARRDARRRFVYLVGSDADVRPWTLRDRVQWRRVLYRRGLRAADRVVAQKHEQVRALARNHGVVAEVVRSFQPPPDPPRGGKRGLLWVGRAVGLKRAEFFLDLAERLPEIPCALVLNPSHDTEYYERLRRRAEGLDNVKHLEHVPYDRIMELFHAARLYIGTSRWEGFPNTYLQSWRASTPVVSLSVDPDGLIASEGLGEVTGDDFDRMVEIVVKRYDDATWLEETGARAREYLRRNHDPERLVEQWARLITALKPGTSRGGTPG